MLAPEFKLCLVGQVAVCLPDGALVQVDAVRPKLDAKKSAVLIVGGE